MLVEIITSMVEAEFSPFEIQVEVCLGTPLNFVRRQGFGNRSFATPNRDQDSDGQ